MCISDYRIAALIRHSVQAFDTAAGTGIAFIADPERVGLLFGFAGAPSTTSAVIVTFSDGSIINVASSNKSYLMRMEEYGDLVKLGGTITTVGVNRTGAITMFTLPKEYVAAGIDEFRRQLSQIGY